MAYSEILTGEKGTTAAGFLARAADFFATHGIEQIQAVMTDSHWSYTRSRAVADALGAIGADHLTIRPHRPWRDGKVERFNPTLQTEWVHRQIFTTTTNDPKLCNHDSSTTTTNATTSASADHPSAD